MKHKDLMAAAELISSGNRDDLVKGLGTAESIEQESIAFYTTWAQKAKNMEMKKFFEFMAGQEKGHLEAIGKLKASIGEKGEWDIPELQKADFKVFTEKDWDKGEQDAVTAVLFALWKEREAREFYLSAAANVKDESARKFFEALAEFEQGHADMLGEYIEESFYSHELIMG